MDHPEHAMIKWIKNSMGSWKVISERPSVGVSGLSPNSNFILVLTATK
jgi:hypothetical protein